MVITERTARVCGGGAGAQSIVRALASAPALHRTCTRGLCQLPEFSIQGPSGAVPNPPRIGTEGGEPSCLHASIDTLTSHEVGGTVFPGSLSNDDHARCPTAPQWGWLGHRWHVAGPGPRGHWDMVQTRLLADCGGMASQAPLVVHWGPSWGVFRRANANGPDRLLEINGQKVT